MHASTQTAAIASRTSVRWKIFVVLLGLVSLNYIDRASISIAMPMIAAEFQLTPGVQGLLLSSFFWTYALMQVPGGMLADRFKPRIVIALAAVIWGAFQAVAGLCTTTVWLFITRLGLGASEAPVNPSGGKLNGLWMTPHERGRAAALLDGGAPLGAALGSVLIAALISVTNSWRAAFIIAGVATMLGGIVAWRFIRNSPREHLGVNDAEAEYIESANRAEAADDAITTSSNPFALFMHRTPWLMFFGYMCANIVFYGLLTWMPNYLHKVHGFDIRQMGSASFIIFLCGFFGELVGGWTADKLKSSGIAPNKVMRSVLGFAAIVVTVAIFSVAYTTGPVLTVVLLSVTLFFQRWTGLYWSMPSTLTTRRRAGLLGGVMNLGGNIGGVLVPLAVGLIVQWTGSYFLALMVFTGAGVGLFLCSVLINYEKRVIA